MPPIYKSLAFWKMVAIFVTGIILYYAPTLPINDTLILALVLTALQAFSITPELRARGLMASKSTHIGD
jgi:hypothetical protein